MADRVDLKQVKFSSEGWRKVLLSEEVRDIVSNTASDIAARAGAGFNPTVYEGDYGGGRWVGAVHADTYAAMRAEAEDKVLSKAVG